MTNRTSTCRQRRKAITYPLAAAVAFWATTSAPTRADPAPAASAVPAPLPCPAGTRAQHDYALQIMGNVAGYMVVCRQQDSSRVVHFAFNDRGRGPALRSQVRSDAAGLPTVIETDGNDYYKGPVRERYSRAAGTASWQNKVESGSSAVDGAAFYVSQAATPEETAQLARALLRAPGQRLRLLPQGEASLRRVTAVEVGSGPSARRLTLYAIEGLGFQPGYVWLDGESELFAALDGWSALVRRGHEDLLARLRAEQDAQAGRRRAEQARLLRRVPAGALAIEHASVFDATTATMRPGTTVVVAQGRIVAVGPDGTLPLPADAERIDAGGRALLPGLWDMHAHPELDDGPLFLAAGVTSVRDMAAEPDKPARLRVFDSGEALGPRVVYAGIIDGRGPFQAPTRTLVDTAAEARTAVQAMDAAGFRMVKIYSSLDPQLVPVVAAEAHSRGMRVGGHVPAFMTAEQAVRAGYDELQHMNMVYLNFLATEVADTRTPARFHAVAEHAAEIDPQSARVQAFLGLLRQRQVTLDPTLTAFEGLFTARPGAVSAEFAAVADRMPPQVRRGFLEGGLPVPEGADARYRDAFRQMQRMLLAVREAGIPLVAGTDSLAGFSLARELELYVEAGIPAGEVLRLATLDAARAAGRGDELGSIEPGKRADLVLVAGDPSRRMGDLRRVRLVLKDGAVYDPDAMCEALGIRPLPAAER